MLSKLIFLLIVLVGLVNFLPVLGLFSVERLSSAYGIGIADDNLQILLKHRALLFGIVGGLVWASAFVPAWRSLALSLAGISMLGFVLIAWQVGGFNEAMRNIALADLLGLLLLSIAAILMKIQRRAT